METLDHVASRRVSLLKKLNPIWWFGNEFEPEPPDWYKAQEPKLTTLKWYLRNPGHNMAEFGGLWPLLILGGAIAAGAWWFGLSYYWAALPLVYPGFGGFSDKSFRVYGTAPINTTDKEDIQLTGFMWKVCMLYGFIPLPYFSYCSKRWMVHAGWNQFGKFVRKLNFHGSKVQFY